MRLRTRRYASTHCGLAPNPDRGTDEPTAPDRAGPRGHLRLSCHRHDFGYRNYHAAGQFGANKARLDDAFYADLQRKCATYSSVVRPACYSLAWIYYQAVRQFGDTIVTPEQLAQAAELMPGELAESPRM